MSDPSDPALGRLERVPLSNAWRDEALEFTPWLAREENLNLLSEEINVRLSLEGREIRVGPFRADLVCRDLDSDRIVIIENQLRPSDHRHLGQVMTYAAALEAFSIVWISEHFLPEHSAAVDWLNDMTAEGVDFFAVEIELYNIDSSVPAPKFQIISKPNKWRRKRHKFNLTETAHKGDRTEPDCFACARHLLGFVVFDGRLRIPLPVSDLIKSAASMSDALPIKHANKIIADLGVKVLGRATHASVLVANNCDGLEKIFWETRWGGGGWKKTLMQMKGVEVTGSQRFHQQTSRAIKIPVSSLFAREAPTPPNEVE